MSPESTTLKVADQVEMVHEEKTPGKVAPQTSTLKVADQVEMVHEETAPLVALRMID
jgi:hypothetical protein